MDIDTNSFALREEIFGHNAAVRSMCVSTTGDLVTGGADALANVWSLEGLTAERTQQVADHEHNVTAMTPLPIDSLEDCPTGGFVTGSQDKTIRIYNSEGVLVRQLLGHSHGVISLSFLPDSRFLLSGSWDGTARVWDLKDECKCVATLPDHENGVSVLGLTDGNIATGSTGKQENGAVVGFSVRIWTSTSPSEWSLVSRHNDHAASVRCLATTPLGFMSTSNDGSVRIRSNSGETLHTVIHPQSGLAEPFLYQGAALVSEGIQEYVSCAEDCSAAVWSADSSRMQLLEHPDTVWCACALLNGDVATGCNDGVIRLWTRDQARMAAVGVQQAYAQGIEESKAKKRGGPSAEEIAKLPHWSNRFSSPGRGEGDVKVFNKEGVAIAAQWSAASSDWVEVGQVTGSRDSGMIDGVSYDHVLPVEFEQPGLGLTKLQIGYNDGENPYTTAQQFIARYELDPGYLEQIAEYIRKNAGGSAPTLGESTVPTQTASSASSQSASQSVTKPSTPKTTVYIKFDKPLSVEKIKAKLMELSQSMEEAGMNSSEQLVLDNMCSTLANTSRWHASNISKQEAALLLKLSVEWPIDKVFPVMDLLRILVLHPAGAEALSNSSVFTTTIPMNLARCGEEGCAMPLQLTTLRFICNCFVSCMVNKITNGQTPSTLVRAAQALILSDNKNVRCAAATLLYNISLALGDATSGLSGSAVFEVVDICNAISGATALFGTEGRFDEESLTIAILAAKLVLEATGDRSLLQQGTLPSDLGRLIVGTGESEWQKKRIEAAKALHAIVS